ncbi:MAG TPA: NADH-quinone oxidoreductase subunit J [Vicinamibacteria bacterium]|nr:NADH-quinone oxidoreductase subunit J [Vicinamibacteria bacterium]
MDAILFYVFAAVALGGALVVVGQRSPIQSAFSLVLVLCSLSGIYGLLGSPFIATLQIVVYAGAIMVLFLFVLMLLSVRSEEQSQLSSPRLKASAFVLCILLLVQAGTVILRAKAWPEAVAFDASTRSMARELFSPHFLYAFEATSVLILAALVGAVALAKKEL